MRHQRAVLSNIPHYDNKGKLSPTCGDELHNIVA